MFHGALLSVGSLPSYFSDHMDILFISIQLFNFSNSALKMFCSSVKAGFVFPCSIQLYLEINLSTRVVVLTITIAVA